MQGLPKTEESILEEVGEGCWAREEGRIPGGGGGGLQSLSGQMSLGCSRPGRYGGQRWGLGEARVEPLGLRGREQRNPWKAHEGSRRQNKCRGERGQRQSEEVEL